MSKRKLKSVIFMAFLLAATWTRNASAETAVYSPVWQAPVCTSGTSPCEVPVSLIRGRDNFTYRLEPNGPNTLISSPCADGSSGTSSSYEYLDSFTLTDYSSPSFKPGDTLAVNATVYCRRPEDTLMVFMEDNPSSPKWNFMGSAVCMSGGVQSLFVPFTMPAYSDSVALRAVFAYNPVAVDNPCPEGIYDDHDDLVFLLALDADKDGLPDAIEDSYCTDTNNPDTDGDGLCDGSLAVGSTCIAGEDMNNDGNVDEETDPCDPDTDGDLMPDGWEVVNGLNPLYDRDWYRDADFDLLINRDEYLNGTDPQDPDTDGDNMEDRWEVDYIACMDPLDPDSASADYDSDTLDNGTEHGELSNPCSSDGDSDGMPDAWEYLHGLNLTFDDADDDDDGDGLTNLNEYLSGGDPNDPDSDGDGMPDGYEYDRACLDLMTPDAAANPDGDGANNLFEYGHGTEPCVFDDTDGDGMLDSYENLHSCLDVLVGDSQLDGDGEGLENILEYNLGTDPCNIDSDGDELDDLNEYYVYFSDPLDIDTDGEGLDDFLEAIVYRSDPNLTDTDGDGLSDAFEVGVVIGTGTNRLIDTTPAGDDNSYHFAIWLGDNMDPETTAVGDDLQVIDPALPYVRFFITAPDDPDTDGDGIDDLDEIKWGADPTDPAITPEMAASVGQDFRITHTSTDTTHPELVWADTMKEFGLVYQDDVDVTSGELYFQRLAMDGHTIGAHQRITSVVWSPDNPELAFTGSEYALVHSAGSPDDIYFTRISTAGAPITGNIRITDNSVNSRYPGIAWTGSRLGVSWNERTGVNEYDAYFARLTAVGTVEGTLQRITSLTANVESSDLAWTGSHFGISWGKATQGYDDDEIFLDLVNDAGSIILSDQRITSNDSLDSLGPMIAWSGSEYGLTWIDERDTNFEIYFARINSSGTKVSSDIRVTYAPNSSFMPKAIWDGEFWSVFFNDQREGSLADQIFMATLDEEGTKVASDFKVSNSPAYVWGGLDAEWTGSEYGVIWYEQRDGNHEIYFTRVSRDLDGDDVPDSIEHSIPLDPSNFDTDFDGISDGQELNYPTTDFTCMAQGNCEAITGCELESYDGHNYLICSQTKNWSNARKDCLAWGGDLVAIDDESEQTAVGNHMTTHIGSNRAWNGLIQDPAGAEPDQGWFWSHGSPASYTYWYSGQPNEAGVQDCATFYGSSHLWVDYSCYNSYQYVCEDNFHLDPSNSDSDDDGLTDGDEINIYNTNPNCSDTDGDGISDLEEVTDGEDGVITDPLSDDGDNDGVSDMVEISMGSNPDDPNIVPSVHSLGSAETRISFAGEPSEMPKLLWTGSEYAVFWRDQRYVFNNNEIFFQRMDPKGDLIGSETRLTYTTDDCLTPSPAWSGSEFGVGWTDWRDVGGGGEIYFARFDPTGGPIGSDYRVTYDTGNSYIGDMVWSRSEYGVVWDDASQIKFARISEVGVKIGSDLVVGTPDLGGNPIVEWSDANNNYAAAWKGSWESVGGVGFRRISFDGGLIGTETRLINSDESASYPDMAATEYDFAVTYRNGMIAKIFGVKLTNQDSYLTGHLPYVKEESTVSVFRHDIKWSGDFFGMAWADMRDSDTEIYLGLIHENGEILGEDLRISHLVSSETNPSIAWSGSEFGACWSHTEGAGNTEIYCTTVRVDPDGDGAHNALEIMVSTDPLDWDSDDDGLSDYDEICYDANCNGYSTANDPDPNNPDTDGDGLSDYDEVMIHYTNPNQPDSDFDGMPDKWEVENGLSPLAPDAGGDADLDGATNYTEFLEGTDPQNPDTDGDGIQDDFEIINPCMMANTVDNLLDYDVDGLNNLTESILGLDPCSIDDPPESSCSLTSPALTNGETIGLDYNVDSIYAYVYLYQSIDGAPYTPVAGPVTGALAGHLTINTTPNQYQVRSYYTIASLSVFIIEPPPMTPDTTATIDRIDPLNQDVTDTFGPYEGDYQSSTSQINALITATDQGQSGIAGFEYAVGTAVYPGGNFDSVLGWTTDADGVINASVTLSQGMTYFVTGRAVNNAGNVSQALSTDGIIVNISASSPPTVSDDGAYSGDLDLLHATWAGASDPTSGVDHYQYAIGTTSGATDVRGWTDHAASPLFADGLSLTDGVTYFIGVRAVNGAGLTSSAGWSDGIMVDSVAPVIAEASPYHRQIVFGSLHQPGNRVWLDSLNAVIGLDDLNTSGISWPQVAVVLDFTEICNGDCVHSGDTVNFSYGDTLGMGNHVMNVQAEDLAGNQLFQNVIFVVEDPRKVIINPVWSELQAGETVTFVADGGTGEYHWVGTGGTLNLTSGSTVVYTAGTSAGAYVVAVSDQRLVSAQATVIVRGTVDVGPAVVRLNQGDTVSFTASGGTGTYNWSATGGTCAISANVCLFTAGGSDGEYSVTATEVGGSGASFTSRVIVVGSVGRAIIAVGGGLVDSNRQVDTLNAMGSFAYETLLARGFSKDQILYLNPDATQMYDGDGDGYADDIDGAPTLASLGDAITVWALENRGVYDPPVGPGRPLILYLVDHGSPDEFLLNQDAGGDEVLTPAQLDTWLDTLQAGATVTVLIVYDACYAGTFIDELGAGGPNRIVMSSSSDTESSYFGVNGTISFSQFFWQQVRQGKTAGDAFDLAGVALAGWVNQTPWLDDNGTGAYEVLTPKDGATAADFEIGADFSTGALLPELTTCVDTALLDSATCWTSYTLDTDADAVLFTEVDNVQPGEVGAVFAIISPPGYSAPVSPPGTFETPSFNDLDGSPLPRVYLEWDAGNGHWSHVFTGGAGNEIQTLFTENGRYTATLFALDRRGLASASQSVELVVFGPDSFEPDDDYTAASAIEANTVAAQAHNFHQDFDEDWATFTLAGGTSRIVSVYTENLADNCDTIIELWSSDLGAPSELLLLDDDSGEGFGASMINLSIEPGDYFVRVYHYLGSTYGEGTEYDLRVLIDYGGDTGTLEGYVTDEDTGYGIYDATVKLLKSGGGYLTTKTRTGGYYVFLNTAPAGAGHQLEVKKLNYVTQTVAAPTIDIGGLHTRDVVLPRATDTGVIAGVVSDGSTLLSGAVIVISGSLTYADDNGFFTMRLAAGSYIVRSYMLDFQNYEASGVPVSIGVTTDHDIVMLPVDADGDLLSDAMEDDGGQCTDSALADTDGDGLCDGDTAAGGCVAGEDLDRDGVVDPGETDPCDDDTDNDGSLDGVDCDPLDPFNWDACGTCIDADGDGYKGTGCNLSADCNDGVDNVWSNCSDCPDVDGDGTGAGASCEAASDCDDSLDTGAACSVGCSDFYLDSDSDTYGAGAAASRCSAPSGYVANNTDCAPADGDHWSDCGICTDVDGDDYGALCDLGADCDDSALTGGACTTGCTTYYNDGDTDTYGDPAAPRPSCSLPAGYVADNTDCAPYDGDHWSDCGSCIDVDGDDYGTGCDLGADCDDTLDTGASCFASCSNFYADSDTDSYGDPADSIIRCSVIAGYVADNTDCEPAIAETYPGAPEVCDTLDNQCPGDVGYGEIDEGISCGPADTDDDGISDDDENTIYFTNPNEPDSDFDGFGDLIEAVTIACLDPLDPDSDADGLADGVEDGNTNGVVDGGETDPCDSDSDDDTLTDGLEGNTLGSDPLSWDSDGDALPDAFEYAHRADGQPLDLNNAADGLADFDSDLNPNVHEYYNSTDLWVPDPQNHIGHPSYSCAYWGEANGDCNLTATDRSIFASLILGGSYAYADTIPHSADIQDLNGDNNITSTDLSLLTNIILSGNPGNIGSRPVQLDVVDAPIADVAVGSTCRVTVQVLNFAGNHTSGLSVKFTIDPSSTATVTVLGGDGSESGDRYDITGPGPDGYSSIVLRPDTSGTLNIVPVIDPCGTPGLGRYLDPAVTSPAAPIVITVAP